MSEQFRIAGLGEVLYDAFPDGERLGGAPANFACHCHAQGAEAYLVSAVGDDARGKKARDFLEHYGVNTDCLALTPAHPTGVVHVTLDEAGKPMYTIEEGVAWDNIPYTSEMQALAPRLDAVCFGSLAQRNTQSRESIAAFLDATRPDCLRVFDINLRLDYYTEESIRTSLEWASALKLNDEELPLVANLIAASGSEEDQLKAIRDHFQLSLIVLTCGGDGAWMVTPEETSKAAAATGTIVSTVGAGDSFTATTIMGVLAGDPLPTVNERANAVAMKVCAQAGAVFGADL